MIRGIQITFIVIITVLVIALLQTCESKRLTEQTLAQTQEEAVMWKDKFGRSNAELVVSEMDLKHFNQLHGDIVDSLKEQLNIKAKRVASVQTIATHTTDTIFLKTGKPYTSKWASFSLQNDSLVYLIKDSLALVTHDKKYGFLNLKTKYVTRAISFNPNTIITGLTSIEIKPKERRLSIGVYGGYGATLSGGELRVGPQAGIGFNYRIF